MPEGPEVRDLAIRLNLLLAGKKIVGATSLFPKYSEVCKKIIDCKVNRIFSKGKVILWEINNGELYIYNHLKMTGWWIYGDKFPLNPERNNSTNGTTRFILDIEDYKEQLIFVDNINLAQFDLISKNNTITILQSLGYDPLTKIGFNYIQNHFSELIMQSSKSAVGNVLMDQNIICGIGNYLRSEILWTAQINPFKTVGELSDSELSRLKRAVLQVPNKIFKLRCTDKQYVFKVYGQKNRC